MILSGKTMWMGVFLPGWRMIRDTFWSFKFLAFSMHDFLDVSFEVSKSVNAC